MKKDNHLIFIFLLLLLLCPTTVYADVTSESISSSSSPEGHNGKCKNYLGISINAEEYNRVTTISSDVVSPRKITIKCKGRCKAYMYYASYGSLENLEKNIQISDEDEDVPDDIKVKKKTFSDSYDGWSLAAGQEALIVVVSLSNKNCTTDKKGKTTCTYSAKVAKKDYCPKKGSSGKCAVATYDIKCPRGNFSTTDNATDAGEVNITGNGAALFIQNPKDSLVVPNLRVKTNDEFGEACRNAYNGIYDGKDSEKKLYSITDGQELEKYRTDYYPKILNYCDLAYVPFNLKSGQIKNLANNLLKVFYYAKQLDKEYQSVESINNEIKEIEKNLDSSHIITKAENLNQSLKCDSKTSIAKEESYLYKTKEETVTATLSSNKTVSVCTTKCYEYLTVKYEPPATVKAGLCFQYKVTVKSVAKCGMDTNFNLDNISGSNMCSPTPICNNEKGHTQAGPSDEFDSCINSCDGGKYTQSCINSCYKKVYGDEEKTSNKNTTTSNDVVVPATVTDGVISLENKNSSTIIKKLASNDYEESELENYQNEKNNKTCTTEKIIGYVNNNNDKKLSECAEYFFQAKALYPKGHYQKSGNKLIWKKYSGVTNAGAEETSTTHIPMQIARAAPFYLRSVEATKELLVSLVVPAEKSTYWKKYNIDENGVKRQWSTRWTCKQVCKFVGCNDGDVYTSKDYTNNTVSDLEKIAKAISKCTASAACDTTETTTEFTIKINSKTENNNKETVETIPAVGTTTTGSTIGMSTDFDGDGDGSNDMFVAEGKNATGTGILGLCYNGTSTPHYQTTITYPGTYMNYKNGKRLYTSTNDSSYYYKKNYFCTPYNATEVNEKYWNWAINDKYDSNKYPSDFTPEYNITATLGNSNKSQRFGKYNWTIDFKCFYSLSNAICKCSTDHPECCPKDKCDSENSSHICNANFRVVDSAVLFPDENGKAITDESQLPFNWTSKAQDNDTIHNSKLIERGYRINPKEYRETLEKNASSAFDNNGTIAYHIYLDKDNINEIKNYVNTHGYTEYSGTYTAVEGITGLYYYTSTSVIENQTLVKDYSRNTELGYNK